ncbi:gag/pol protein [Cucumis melo var. makuwa]|uniref:Gag/pol protein n=1 Tax=Cucumis melo var. makuwa TaxID=1194695 RepID=A0A5A7VAK2_CUCMM|nr:gag/pol protein [Cucumis melo var. makuwa]TYK16418.1 gag/pol protein [Cucumis melo var. makuwa]
MILVITDLRFVLMEECPPFPTKYASQSEWDAFDRWTKVNDKARLYILASMSDILSKKHEIMVTARQIIDSLREMFGQPSIQIKQEANVVHSRRFVPSSSGSEKIQKRKEGKGKGPTIAVEGKRKAKVVIKEKCFHCNDDEHWKINCPKYLVKKKEKEGATNHVCSSLQETSSIKQLEESEMTLKVGTGDVISARAVGNAKYGYLYLMEYKSEALEKFKEYKAEVENLLTPGTPQQNGVSERRNRILLDMVRSMMSYAQLPSSFWGYAVETAVHILNNVPSKSVSETLFKLWRGRKPSLSHFRIWGCPAHMLVTNPKKLEPRSRLCQFVGYPKETRGGLLFDPQENRVFVSTNATFLEEDHMRVHKP